MKKTLIGLFIIGMLLTTLLPINALAALRSADDDKTSTLTLGRTTVRGIALRLGTDGRYAKLFAIRLHFVTITADGQHTGGVIWLKKVNIPARTLGYHGRYYIYASFIGTIRQYP